MKVLSFHGAVLYVACRSCVLFQGGIEDDSSSYSKLVIKNFYSSESKTEIFCTLVRTGSDNS